MYIYIGNCSIFLHMQAMFTPTRAGANNAHTRGRSTDMYDRGYNRGSGCNEGTDYEALRLARQGELDQHGYHNDGFVVPDSQSEDDEDSSSDYNPEELPVRLRSRRNDAEDSSSDYHPTDEDTGENSDEDGGEEHNNAEEDDDGDSDYIPSDEEEEEDDDEDDDSSSDYNEWLSTDN